MFWASHALAVVVLGSENNKAQHVISTTLVMAQVASSVVHLASASTDIIALALVCTFVLTHVAKIWWRKMRIQSDGEDVKRGWWAMKKHSVLRFLVCLQDFFG